jgi:hypothetical protein
LAPPGRFVVTQSFFASLQALTLPIVSDTGKSDLTFLLYFYHICIEILSYALLIQIAYLITNGQQSSYLVLLIINTVLSVGKGLS